jgi:hypothetical protein
MAKTVIIPSNPADLQKINKWIKDACDCKTRIAAENEAIKDIVAVIKEEFKLPPKFTNKLIRTKYKDNFDQQETEQEDFAELYGKVIK